MKVLWFTNIPMPPVLARSGGKNDGSGFWMSALSGHLAMQPDMELSIAVAGPRLANAEFTDQGIRYFTLQQSDDNLDPIVQLVKSIKPDLIHIHGTERFYGLLAAQRLVECPVVISLQGILRPYLRAYFGSLGLRERLRANRWLELASGRGIFWDYVRTSRAARREDRILAADALFLGRTAWDRACLEAVNPTARYSHVGELLRHEFWESSWSLDGARRQSILFTNWGSPRRGVETLLRALPIVQTRFPHARLRLAGNLRPRNGYQRFILRMIADLGLTSSVDLIGYCGPETLANELLGAHAFVIPSAIENSPNSLCEAMLAGVPSLAAYTGGIPSLVEDGHSGLLFSPGDHHALAGRLVQLFSHDDLARSLSTRARAAARQRHAPAVVVDQLLQAYNTALRQTTCPTLTASRTW